MERFLYEKLDYINIENTNKYIKSIDIEVW